MSPYLPYIIASLVITTGVLSTLVWRARRHYQHVLRETRWGNDAHHPSA